MKRVIELQDGSIIVTNGIDVVIRSHKTKREVEKRSVFPIESYSDKEYDDLVKKRNRTDILQNVMRQNTIK